jgi:hypothetical protein
MTTSANHSMVSGVHYVGLVQPLTTSFTRLIIGGHCNWRPLQPKYWGTRPRAENGPKFFGPARPVRATTKTGPARPVVFAARPGPFRAGIFPELSLKFLCIVFYLLLFTVISVFRDIFTALPMFL